jgi:threonyl-tRNA synthetase
MPGRLGASYIAEDGGKHVPVMLHRAILGSLERFIGILIEHYAGSLPLWLAPEQAMVLNITDKHADYAKKVEEALKKQGVRVKSDLRNEKIGFKIREHTIQHVPYLLVVGDREAESDIGSTRISTLRKCVWLVRVVNRSALFRSKRQRKLLKRPAWIL